MYVNKTEICKFKVNDNTSGYNFCLGSVSKDFTKDEQSEFFLYGTLYDLSADHSPIKKEDAFNIHQYLMVKNNKIIGFIQKMFIGLLTSIINASNHTKCASLNNQQCMT